MSMCFAQIDKGNDYRRPQSEKYKRNNIQEREREREEGMELKTAI